MLELLELGSSCSRCGMPMAYGGGASVEVAVLVVSTVGFLDDEV